MTQQNAKLKRKPGARDPSTLTPEYIAEQRKLRELKKQERQKNQAAVPNAIPEHLNFVKRELLNIPGQTLSDDDLQIKIMSYNVLAQALIRRELFPTSGQALKWGNRSQVLLSEFKYYDADIMCLQEVDYIQYNSFWKPEFHKMGYNSLYHRSGAKNHGVAVVFKRQMFDSNHHLFIDYDSTETGETRNATKTQNVGLLVYLNFRPEILQSHPKITKHGIIIGTTHLFWHPFGTYERTRQTYIVLHKMKEFERMMKAILGNEKQFYRFFAGDFNSQPYDSPYLSITAKPARYQNRAKTVLGRAISHQWDNGKNSEETSSEDENPVPDSFDFQRNHIEVIQKLEDLHNSIDQRAISLYSVGYRSVHPENSGIDNDRNEPIFSNWAHTWRGLLDYIFVISDWDGTAFNDRVDDVHELAENQKIKILSLLRLPTKAEMGPEPSGQPRAGQYPSDHLCLMAKVSLC